MVALDRKTGGVQFGRYSKSNDLSAAMSKYIKEDKENLFFVCIGTDRATGDSLAPLFGTMLLDHGYTNVIGDIDNPVHAVNLDERLKEVPEGRVVIAIDASLGKSKKNVGMIAFNKGSLSPGAGVGKELTPVGDYNLQGCVNVGYEGFDEMNHQILCNTRLSTVLKMAKEIVKSVEIAFPLNEKIHKKDHEALLKVN